MATMVETGIYTAVIATLIWAAATDLKDRRIPNIQPLLVLGLFGLLALWRLQAGDTFAIAAGGPIVAGLLVFGFCVVLFALKFMGGGDVKLIAAVALIAGPTLSATFLLFVAVAGGVVALVTLVHAHLKPLVSAGPPKVPYGVAIMAGGMWVCLQKVSVSSA